MRENAETKGRRYVAEGRLLVERVDEHGIRASCRGGSVTRSATTASPGSAHVRRSGSAHLIALKLVTVREKLAA